MATRQQGLSGVNPHLEAKATASVLEYATKRIAKDQAFKKPIMNARQGTKHIPNFYPTFLT
ncbi:TPA: hypothetical protein EYN65_20100 [Candidatus Poribacteria bacterium]|nr:hypothetical protein [Candidatus Poribacteria bacterium]